MNKTIRLLYPDYASGGLSTYYFGAHLMAHMLPENEHQPLFQVELPAPDHKELPVEEGIYGRGQVLEGMKKAKTILQTQKPDRVITIGGNCMVSQVPFDYLHGLYENTGIVWIDAHPDVTSIQDGYPYAHAMVLRNLLGKGDSAFQEYVRHPFSTSDVLYIGLQDLHTYQKDFLDQNQVPYTIQTDHFISMKHIQEFVERYDFVLVHLDIDVLDPSFFHSTYFANPELTGDGSGGGRMRLDQLREILNHIEAHVDLAGLTIAEYLPFDEEKLARVFQTIRLFQD